MFVQQNVSFAYLMNILENLQWQKKFAILS